MNTVIGTYEDHELAVDAVRQLKASGYPLNRITIMGKAEEEVIDQDMHIRAKNPINMVGVGAGTTIGAALGILTGVGLFAIPGLGFLYGAGALVGVIGGLDIGLIGGGLATVLATVGVRNENAEKYHDALADGRFLVIVHGSGQDVNTAKEMLHIHGTHEEVAFH